jgi:hypothetical protein
MPISKQIIGLFVGAVVVATGACNKGGVDLDKVAPGTQVTVTRQDGGVVKGPVQSVEPNSLVVKVGARPKTVPRSEISTVTIDEPGAPAKALPPAAKFREFVIPSGTPISVRLMTPVSSDTSRVEQAVSAELREAIVIDGVEVAPAGSAVNGTVLRAEPAGKVKGLASLAVRFNSIHAGGESYPVEMTYSRTAEPTKGSDAKKIGIPAAGGAILGGILGGKKGAVVGGLIGGGAGTAVVLSTSGKEVALAAGSILRLTLDRDLEVKVPIK